MRTEPVKSCVAPCAEECEPLCVMTMPAGFGSSAKVANEASHSAETKAIAKSFIIGHLPL
jgi:hypothetical protein